MKVIFEPLARAEFIEAVRWYAAEAGRIYATDFRNEVHRTLSMASDHPTMGTPANNNTRQLVVHRYPFLLCTESPQKHSMSSPLPTTAADLGIGLGGVEISIIPIKCIRQVHAASTSSRAICKRITWAYRFC